MRINVAGWGTAVYKCWDGTAAVSYTHLDVYKRQVSDTTALLCHIQLLYSVSYNCFTVLFTTSLLG